MITSKIILLQFNQSIKHRLFNLLTSLLWAPGLLHLQIHHSFLVKTILKVFVSTYGNFAVTTIQATTCGVSNSKEGICSLKKKKRKLNGLPTEGGGANNVTFHKGTIRQHFHLPGEQMLCIQEVLLALMTICSR